MLMRAARPPIEEPKMRSSKKKGPLRKTSSFSVLHFGIAFTDTYLIGSALTGGLIAVIEPA
ncbi:DUF2061 domain-containing protein [Pseudomonas putida]|uniref:DUF2061 domain-containing protein n=1 Tax=Pseudomonas putida TaxID=303 RepID=UPI00351EB173